jgi:hypothetical protein
MKQRIPPEFGTINQKNVMKTKIPNKKKGGGGMTTIHSHNLLPAGLIRYYQPDSIRLLPYVVILCSNMPFKYKKLKFNSPGGGL